MGNESRMGAIRRALFGADFGLAAGEVPAWPTEAMSSVGHLQTFSAASLYGPIAQEKADTGAAS